MQFAELDLIKIFYLETTKFDFLEIFFSYIMVFNQFFLVCESIKNILNSMILVNIRYMFYLGCILHSHRMGTSMNI